MPVPVRKTLPPPARPSADSSMPARERTETTLKMNEYTVPAVVVPADAVAASTATLASFPAASDASRDAAQELAAMLPNVVSIIQDKDGSKRLQQLLERVTQAERDMVFNAAMPHALTLFNDVCGNHVMQRILQYATPAQHLVYRQVVADHVLELSLNTFGCRVVQKALEVFGQHHTDCLGLPDILRPLVTTLATDQHGNHVLQRCLEARPLSAAFIAGELKGRLVATSCQKFGCRVVQKLIATVASDAQLTPVLDAIVEEVLGSVMHLSTDQFGNYVVQAIMTCNKASSLRPVYFLRGHYPILCRHKNASNVVETAFSVSPPAVKSALLAEICPCVVQLAGDPFGNYVVQNIFDKSDAQHRASLAAALKAGATFLKGSIYGRSVLAMLQRNGVPIDRPQATAQQQPQQGASQQQQPAPAPQQQPMDCPLPYADALPFPDLQRQHFTHMVQHGYQQIPPQVPQQQPQPQPQSQPMMPQHAHPQMANTHQHQHPHPHPQQMGHMQQQMNMAQQPCMQPQQQMNMGQQQQHQQQQMNMGMPQQGVSNMGGMGMHMAQQHPQQQMNMGQQQHHQHPQQPMGVTQHHLNQLPAMPALVQHPSVASMSACSSMADPVPTPPLTAAPAPPMPPLTQDMNVSACSGTGHGQVMGLLPPLEAPSPLSPPSTTTSFPTSSAGGACEWAAHNPQYDTVDHVAPQLAANTATMTPVREHLDVNYCTSPDNDPSMAYMYSY